MTRPSFSRTTAGRRFLPMAMLDLPRHTATNAEQIFVPVATGPPDHLDLCSLVLCAVHIDHLVDSEHQQLLVPANHAETAREQLTCFFQENRNWPPPRPQSPPLAPSNTAPTVLLVGSLALFYFFITGPWYPANPWFIRGCVTSTTVLEEHQWWRLFTALTLHADEGHLLSNCLIGGFFVHLLTRSLGTGLTWFLLVGCGGLGNLLNMILRPPHHASVGFSTSIFAAIGIFCGMSLANSPRRHYKRILLSLGAGLSFLAILGGADSEQTDISAHFFGFVSGIIGGLAVELPRINRHRPNHLLQHTLLAITLLALGISWFYAWPILPPLPGN